MTDKEKERLAALLGMLGSGFDGERANAALMIDKMAKARKLSIVELVKEWAGPAQARATVAGGYQHGNDYMDEWRRQQQEEALRRAQREMEKRDRQERAERQAQAKAQTGGGFGDFNFNTQPGDQSARMRDILRDLDVSGLNDWERDFVESMTGKTYPMTPRQMEAAMKIVRKANGEGDMYFRRTWQ